MSDAMTDMRNNKKLRDEIESLRQQLSSRDAEIAKAFEAGRQAEREECAKVCEGRLGGAFKPDDWWAGFQSAMAQCAKAIRARGYSK